MIKELSIEEKAARYDRSIERARDVYTYYCDDREQLRKIESIFPELKESESEDEKIRKGLIEGFQQYDEDECWRDIDYLKIKDILSYLKKHGKNDMGISEATKKKLEDNLNKALEKETPESWNEFLEKQGKQKLISKNKVGDTIYYNSFGEVKSMIVADVVIVGTDNPMYEDKEGNAVFEKDLIEQNPAKSNDIEGVLLVHNEILNNLLERYKTSATFKILIVNLKNWWNNTRRHLLSFNIEQKPKITDWSKHIKYEPNSPSITKENPVWSEEDEEILNLIIARLHSHPSVEAEEYNKDYHWFKALKERVQSKQEWSEQDELKIKSIIALLKSPALCAMDGNKGIIEENIKYLKSLKDRLGNFDDGYNVGFSETKYDQ